MKWGRMCEVFVTTLVAGWLYSGCLAQAQNPQCPTRPVGDSTNACASTAFVQTAITSNFANPTALVGLTAVNGVATTGMRSDAAPALDQAIVPTWTGLHTFSANATVNLPSRTVAGTTDTLTSADNKHTVIYSNAAAKAVTLNVLTAGSWVFVQNNGAGTATVTPSSGTIGGAANYAVLGTDSVIISSDGTNASVLQLGLWAAAVNDFNFLNRFYGIANTAGFPVNINANGSISGNYTSPFSLVMNYPTTHTGSQNFTFSAVNQSPGSSPSSAGGSSDGAILASAQQSLYLTTSVNAEIDTLWVTNFQGVNATGNAGTFTLTKRSNGTVPGNSAATLEGDVALVNGSGLGAGTIAQNHYQLGQLISADAAFGAVASFEGWNNTWGAGVRVDTFNNSAGTAGSTPTFTCAFEGRKLRNAANQYFCVDPTGILSLGIAGTSAGKVVFRGSASGSLTMLAAAAAGANTITWPAGTTDFSATGGTSQVVKQISAGSAFTVAQLAASDLSNGTTGTGAIALADSPTFTTKITTPKVIGGSGTTGTQLSLQTTSGNGTTDAIAFLGGNNGASTFATLNSTGLGIGASPDTKLTLSANATSPPALLSGALGHMVGVDSAGAIFQADTFGGAGTGAAFTFTGRRSGGTNASPSALGAFSILVFDGRGFDGSVYTGSRVAIQLSASETWSSGVNGTQMIFQTTPNGTATIATAMTVQNSGGVSVGTSTDPGIGKISANVGFVAAGSSGTSATKTVRASGGAADCTLIFTGGILTGGTC